MYRIKIVQCTRYTETLIGHTDDIEKAKDIMNMVLEIFPDTAVSIEVDNIKMPEAEAEAEAETETETETEEE